MLTGRVGSGQEVIKSRGSRRVTLTRSDTEKNPANIKYPVEGVPSDSDAILSHSFYMLRTLFRKKPIISSITPFYKLHTLFWQKLLL